MGQMAVQGVMCSSHVGWPSREALRRDEACGPTQAFLGGLQRGVGSCNPGPVVDGDGLILSPDSFILKNDQRRAVAFQSFQGFEPTPALPSVRLAFYLVPV